MTFKMSVFTFSLLLTLSETLADSGQREPLLNSQGEVIFEARNVILDSDAYPRPAGRLVEGPTIHRDGDGFQIRFALDQPDDVLVRIVDEQGRVLRTLGCGVLGANAPEPFQKEALQQSVRWDGRDDRGRSVPDGSRVQVAVGLSPKFEQFVGHDPGQLLSQIIWMEVDPQGRLYVQVGSGRKTDPQILRLDREGEYVDMVYPPSPESLKKMGKTIDEVWPFVARYNGEAIPHRPRSWPTFVPYRADALIPFPMRIAGDGTVYIAEATTGYPKWASDGELFRLFTTHVDHFWFLELMPLMYSIGPFAIDDQGHGYIVTSTGDRATGTYPPTLECLNDSRAPGTIRKVNLSTGELQADFEYNGEEQLEEPSAYLGVTQTVPRSWKPKAPQLREPDAEYDDHQRFPDLADLSIDPAGRLLIVDGWPRRLKIYEDNGRYLGELSGLDLDGEDRPFHDLRGVSWSGDGFYLLGVFRDDREQGFLAKCAGDVLNPRVLWSIEVDGQSRHLAVDRSADPPLIWVGMGNGPASLTRVTDLGDEAGEVRHVGGVPPRTFRYPWNIAADSRGHLYVHDRDRESLVRTDESLSEWKEIPLEGTPVSMLADEVNGRLLLSFSFGENGGYSQDRLQEGGFLSFDLETLERLPFRLEPVYNREELSSKNPLFSRRRGVYYPWTKTYGGQFVGVDETGNLYVRDAARDQRWHKATPSQDDPFAGVIRKYAPDGSILYEDNFRLFNTGGGASMDSQGNVYAVELPLIRWHSVVHDFQTAIGSRSIRPGLTRGGEVIRTQSGFTHLVKLSAGGGERDSDAEQWAHRGVSGTNGGGCYCDWPDMHTTVDAADRIYAADVDLHMVKVLDTAGNMIARIGRWGNAETLPGEDGHAADLGFRMIYGLAATGDHLFVSDKDLRRIARIRMAYRNIKEADLP
jgi:hypothetical protein